MRYYLKAEVRATISMFKGLPGAAERCNALYDYNNNLIAQLFDLLAAGHTIYQISKHRLDIYHPSPRTVGAIQVSHFCKMGSEWIPTSHDNITADKLKRELWRGNYVNIIA